MLHVVYEWEKNLSVRSVNAQQTSSHSLTPCNVYLRIKSHWFQTVMLGVCIHDPIEIAATEREGGDSTNTDGKKERREYMSFHWIVIRLQSRTRNFHIHRIIYTGRSYYYSNFNKNRFIIFHSFHLMSNSFSGSFTIKTDFCWPFDWSQFQILSIRIT